jgi:NAD(P)-dependent dehydrogenase (short-subunit alcohol dehydrogenase family)
MLPPTVALVTGGTSGLGLAVAERLVAAGVIPVVTGRSKERGDRAQEILGDSAVYVHGDVASDSNVTEALDVAALHGCLRIVVNCAGVAHAAKVVSRNGPHPLQAFMDVMAVNLVGTFNVIRLAAERMITNSPIEQERGVIINTASAAAFDGQVGQAAYAASKGGVISMTLPLARELAGSLIRVVTVAPGFFETPLVEAVPEKARLGLNRDLVYPQRWGNPQEFAGLVAHIIDNQMINGETIRIDGAVRMSPRPSHHPGE